MVCNLRPLCRSGGLNRIKANRALLLSEEHEMLLSGIPAAPAAFISLFIKFPRLKKGASASSETRNMLGAYEWVTPMNTRRRKFEWKAPPLWEVFFSEKTK
ncbi:uncharacterized [Tachysurus ichikawai]